MQLREGSTLIEAMTAAVILSSALVILLRSYTQALEAVAVQEGYTQAILLLNNKLDVFIAEGGVYDEVNEHDLPSTEGWTFDLNSRSTKMAGRTINRVSITAAWPAGATRPRRLEVTTFLLNKQTNEK